MAIVAISEAAIELHLLLIVANATSQHVHDSLRRKRYCASRDARSRSIRSITK